MNACGRAIIGWAVEAGSVDITQPKVFRGGMIRCACGDALLQWRSVKQEASMVAQYNAGSGADRETGYP